MPMQPNMPDAMPINSAIWWDWYLTEKWDEYGGEEQTSIFMQDLLENLPDEVLEYAKTPGVTIADVGCALGAGVVCLSDRFPLAHVCGVDVAKRGIDLAGERHPSHRFLYNAEGLPSGPVDIMVCSNVLEHFADPWPILSKQLGMTKTYWLGMVPLDEPEETMHYQHKYRFSRNDTFPLKFSGFSLMDTRPVISRGWSEGKEMVVVYKKEG